MNWAAICQMLHLSDSVTLGQGLGEAAQSPGGPGILAEHRRRGGGGGHCTNDTRTS